MLFLISSAAVADGVVYVNVNGKNYPAREGYLIVRHKPGVRLQGISGVHATANAQVVKRFDYPEGLELVKVSTLTTAAQSMSAYAQSSDILYAEPDYLWKATGVPNDPYFSYQYALQNLGQTGGTSNADINAVQAWDITKGDRRVVLGIIDTGVDYTHSDLAKSMWVNSQEVPANGIDDDRNGYIDDVYGINAITRTGNPMDDNIHGSHVAGIIAAQQNNGRGISGVAPNVAIAACKFLDAEGSGDTADAIICLNYFRKLATRSQDPVRVVATNNSWAGGPFSKALYDAIKASQDAGMLFIAAASNEGVNNDAADTYPSNFFLPNVVSVAATDHNDQLADFSNYGHATVSIAAPGVDILSTIPGQKYAYLSGTSMAAPHVTGLAGLIASAYPSLSFVGIKNLILAGGEPIDAASATTITGRRILAYGNNGYGSLSCSNQKVVARVAPQRSTVTVRVNQAVTLAILNINCASPNIVVSSSTASTNPIVLKDDGTGVDLLARDGTYSGTWSATTAGTYRLRFPGNDIVTIKVTR